MSFSFSSSSAFSFTCCLCSFDGQHLAQRLRQPPASQPINQPSNQPATPSRRIHATTRHAMARHGTARHGRGTGSPGPPQPRKRPEPRRPHEGGRRIATVQLHRGPRRTWKPATKNNSAESSVSLFAEASGAGSGRGKLFTFPLQAFRDDRDLRLQITMAET